jgi:hyperosmotically inducible periplasmic protein
MTHRLPLSFRPVLATAAVMTVLLAAAGCSRPTQESAASPAASAATQPSAGASAAGSVANVSDMDVTGNVTRALHGTESLQGQVITVATYKGEVRLTGMLDNQLQVDDAMRIARAADGAHTVHDELTLRK